MLPHPAKLKIDANGHRHLTVDVSYDLSEKTPSKEGAGVSGHSCARDLSE